MCTIKNSTRYHLPSLSERTCKKKPRVVCIMFSRRFLYAAVIIVLQQSHEMSRILSIILDWWFWIPFMSIFAPFNCSNSCRTLVGCIVLPKGIVIFLSGNFFQFVETTDTNFSIRSELLEGSSNDIPLKILEEMIKPLQNSLQICFSTNFFREKNSFVVWIPLYMYKSEYITVAFNVIVDKQQLKLLVRYTVIVISTSFWFCVRVNWHEMSKSCTLHWQTH